MEYVECPTCALAYTWYRLNGRSNDLPHLEREYSVRCVCGTEFDVVAFEEEYDETGLEEMKIEEWHEQRDWRYGWMKHKWKSTSRPTIVPVISQKKRIVYSLNIRSD